MYIIYSKFKGLAVVMMQHRRLIFDDWSQMSIQGSQVFKNLTSLACKAKIQNRKQQIIVFNNFVKRIGVWKQQQQYL